MLLGFSIESVEYPERQKSINISAEGKSVRLDVYVQDNRNVIYDAEMQRKSGDRKSNEELSQRSRYYQGMIDLNLLEQALALDDRSVKVFFNTTSTSSGIPQKVQNLFSVC